MKASELMLGDWVLDTRTKNPLRVNPFMAEMEVPEWQPIPLTPEILNKNGFVNSYIDLSLNTDSVYKYNHFYTGISVIVDMESNKLIVKYENDIWMNLPYRRVIYVHELQHVLKHCEINKAIAL